VEQFRNDKSGLSMEARRKHNFLGQKGYILLTDLAHNLLADFYHRVLVGTELSALPAAFADLCLTRTFFYAMMVEETPFQNGLQNHSSQEDEA